jgi:thiamine kinase-like enzyme
VPDDEATEAGGVGDAQDPLSWDHVLDKVPCLVGKHRMVEQLSGGLTNVNLKVTTDDEPVVVRVAQAGNEMLAIDRDAEHVNTLAAARSGVGAPVVDYLPEAGLLVVGYIDGVTLTEEDLRQGDRLVRIAEACQSLHSGPRFINEFNMFEVQRRYLQLVQEHGFRLPDRYLEFMPQVDQIRAAFEGLSMETMPCNNDLLAGNFIDDGNKIWIIDYEYSGNNDVCFELGNIWSESNLSLVQLDELMEAYDGNHLRHRIARARLWGLMSKYGWTLWASIQSSVSDIDFDFWSWGMEKYERAVIEFDGPGFEALLDESQRND